jgi:ABC-type amino acid transport substrate-binding protein
MQIAKYIPKLLGLLLAAGALLSAVHAQDEVPQNALRIATGPGNGVYAQLAKDIQKVCGQSVPLVTVPSKGGLDNLTLLSSSQADIGFSQVDVLQKMSSGGDQNIQDLQALMAMHSNLLHVIALADGSRIGRSNWILPGEVRRMRRFSDLNIKGVKVVLVGSAILLGQTLERQLGYGMTFLQADSDEQAIAMLQAKQADAIFTTGGWPYPTIAKLRTDSGLMLVDFDFSPPAPFVLTRRNYPNLDAFNMNFLASTNLLLTRPFKTGGERGKQVAALRKCILNNLDELKEGAYHSVWKEIKTPFETYGVAVFGRPDLGVSPTGPAPKAASKQLSKQGD